MQQSQLVGLMGVKLEDSGKKNQNNKKPKPTDSLGAVEI